MKKGKIIGLFLFISLTFSLISSQFRENNKNYYIKSTDDEIHTSNTFYDVLIDDLTANNWTWAKNQGYCTGAGTENDPYVFYNHNFEYNSGNGHCVTIKNSRKYFKFEECSFSYSKHGSAGLFLRNTTNARFQHNHLQFNSIGLLIEECNDSSLTFTDFNCVNLNDNGIIINASNYLYFDGDDIYSFNGLIINDNNNSGIVLKNSHHNLFANIDLTSNGGSGFILNSSNFNLIQECYILNNERDGISLFFSLNNTIFNNEIEQNFQNGIYLFFSAYNNILDNDAIGRNKNSSILLEFSSYNTITRNSRMCTGPCYRSSYGIYMIFSDYNQIIENNYIYNVFGLVLLLCSHNNIIGNTFSSNNGSGIAIWGSNFNTLHKNIADNNGLYGITLLLSMYNDVYENNVRGNDEAGIIAEYCQNNRIFKNTASNNNIGINLISSNFTLVIGNFLSGNVHCIIEENCEDNVFVDNQCVFVDNQFDMIFIVLLSILGLSLVANIALLIFILKKRTK